MAKTLKIDFSREELLKLFRKNIETSTNSIKQDFLSAFSQLIEDMELPEGVKSIKVPITDYHFIMRHDENLSLGEYQKKGIKAFHVPINVNLELEAEDFTEIVLPDFFKMNPVSYGRAGSFSFQVKQKKLKTMKKSLFNLLNFDLTPEALTDMQVSHNPHFHPLPQDVWEWRQPFYNKTSGETVFCSCFKEALEGEYDTNNFGKDKLMKLLENPKYRDNTCHICTGENSDLFYCHPMYKSEVMVRYGAYIQKISIEKGISEREAENEVRELKGIAKIGEKWVNETLLFNYINLIFSSFNVEREASPEWLGRQRLDIYVPELNLALEYHGQQHFKAVEHFGGKEALKKTKERDKLKADLCKKNKVNLIYFTYKDNLSESLVKRRLKKYLKEIPKS